MQSIFTIVRKDFSTNMPTFHNNSAANSSYNHTDKLVPMSSISPSIRGSPSDTLVMSELNILFSIGFTNIIC